MGRGMSKVEAKGFQWDRLWVMRLVEVEFMG